MTEFFLPFRSQTTYRHRMLLHGLRSDRLVWADVTPIRREYQESIYSLDLFIFVMLTAWLTLPLVYIVDSIPIHEHAYQVDGFIAVGIFNSGFVANHGSVVAQVQDILGTVLASTIAWGLSFIFYASNVLLSEWGLFITVPSLQFLLFLVLTFLLLRQTYGTGLFNVWALSFTTDDFLIETIWRRLASILIANAYLFVTAALIPPHLPYYLTQARVDRWIRRSFRLSAKLILHYPSRSDKYRSAMKDADDFLRYTTYLIHYCRTVRARPLERRLLLVQHAVTIGQQLVIAAADLGFTIESAGGVHVVETALRVPLVRVARDLQRQVVPAVLLQPVNLAAYATTDVSTFPVLAAEQRIVTRIAKLIAVSEEIAHNGYYGDLLQLRVDPDRLPDPVRGEELLPPDIPVYMPAVKEETLPAQEARRLGYKDRQQPIELSDHPHTWGTGWMDTAGTTKAVNASLYHTAHDVAQRTRQRVIWAVTDGQTDALTQSEAEADANDALNLEHEHYTLAAEVVPHIFAEKPRSPICMMHTLGGLTVHD